MAKRVLIAEDDTAIQKLIFRVLSRAGFEAETVSNGREAIARIESGAYDALVLDLMMPHTSGFDVVEWLERERPQIAKKSIVITAAAERDTRRIRESEVYAIIRKPFDLQKLVDTVRHCLAEAG